MSAPVSGLAIIAGRGELPRLLAQQCARIKRPYVVVQIKGMQLDWLNPHPVITAEFEKFGSLFADIRRAHCSSVVFAGAVQRPDIDQTRLDAKTMEILPVLAAQMAAGDGSTLRAIAGVFEAEGFDIEAAHEVLPELLAPCGSMGAIAPSDADHADINRAVAIVHALGSADIGQGAVVAQGLCLGAETLQGTDAMLKFVAQTAHGLRPDVNGAKGVLFKGPKPGQDLRMDLPTIGPSTLRNAAKAGLAGVAVQSGKVLILDRAETVGVADKLGLFLFGLPDKTA